jgi:hypothetical protein
MRKARKEKCRNGYAVYVDISTEEILSLKNVLNVEPTEIDLNRSNPMIELYKYPS